MQGEIQSIVSELQLLQQLQRQRLAQLMRHIWIDASHRVEVLMGIKELKDVDRDVALWIQRIKVLEHKLMVLDREARQHAALAAACQEQLQTCLKHANELTRAAHLRRLDQQRLSSANQREAMEQQVLKLQAALADAKRSTANAQKQMKASLAELTAVGAAHTSQKR